MIVLDTHAWLWWQVAPERLSRAASEAIEMAKSVGICSISCWEVTLLGLRKRIALDRPPEAWLRRAMAGPRIESLPLTPEIAIAAALLEGQGFPRDPADRIIYATSRARGVPLVTRDQSIRAFDPARVVW